MAKYHCCYCGPSYELVRKEFNNESDMVHWIRNNRCDSWDGDPLTYRDDLCYDPVFAYIHFPNDVFAAIRSPMIDIFEEKILSDLRAQGIHHIVEWI